MSGIPPESSCLLCISFPSSSASGMDKVANSRESKNKIRKRGRGKKKKKMQRGAERQLRKTTVIH